MALVETHVNRKRAHAIAGSYEEDRRREWKRLIAGRPIFRGPGVTTASAVFVQPTGLGKKADSNIFQSMATNAGAVFGDMGSHCNREMVRKVIGMIKAIGDRNGLGHNYDPRRLNMRHDAVFQLGYWTDVYTRMAQCAGLNWWDEVRKQVGTGSAHEAIFEAAVTPPLTDYIYRYINAMAGTGNKAAALLMLAAANRPGVTIANRAIETRKYLEQEARRGSTNAKRILFFAVTAFGKQGGASSGGIDNYEHHAQPFRELGRLTALVGGGELPGLKQVTDQQLATFRQQAQGAFNAEKDKLLSKLPPAPMGIPTAPPAGVPASRSDLRRLGYETGGAELNKLAQGAGLPDIPLTPDEARQLGVQGAGKLLKKIGGEDMPGIPADVIALLPTDMRGLKQLPAGAAELLGNKLLEEAGLPAILNFDFPDGLTPEAISNMIYSGVKIYIENVLQTATGFPIKLPVRLTVESVLGMLNPLPASVEEFLDQALAVVQTLATQALTTIIAGATAGSVVPGIGTLIGLVVAAITAAMRALFAKPTPPGLLYCEGEPYCPEYTGHLDAMEMLPFIAEVTQSVHQKLAAEQSKDYCGKGVMHDCIFYWHRVVESLVPQIAGTPAELGLPQLDRLIPLYELAPKHAPYFKYKATRITSKQTLEGREMLVVLGQMLRRRTQLEKIMAKANNVETINPGEVAQVRWALVSEMRNSFIQLANQHNPENLAWFKQLVALFARAEKRETAMRLAMLERMRKGKIRATARRKDPRWAQAELKEQLMFKCEDGYGDKAACRQLVGMKDVLVTRQLRALGVPDPALTAPMNGAPAAAPDLQELARAKAKYIFGYLHGLSSAGNKLAALLVMGAAQAPGMSYANQHAVTLRYLEAQAKAGNKPAATILWAGTKQFHAAMRGELPAAPAPALAPPLLPPVAPNNKGAQLRALGAARDSFVFQELHRLKNEGSQAAALLILGASQQPGMTTANKEAQTFVYMDSQAKAGNVAAKEILDALLWDFSRAMAAQLPAGAAAGESTVAPWKLAASGRLGYLRWQRVPPLQAA